MKYRHTVKKNGVLYPAGTEIPEDIPKKVELTDEIPEGALDTNPDGSVNAYDAAGNKVGTVDAKTVERLQEEAGEAWKAQNGGASEPEKPKRGRKPKEV